MIEQIQAMQILVDACPSFEVTWRSHIAKYGNDVLYLAAGDFTSHLLALHQAENTGDFARVGVAIERLLVEGDSWVREFATIGVLEGIQNLWSHGTSSPDAFLEYLGPESQRMWNSVNGFWAGRVSYVGADA